jgi:cell division protein FtsL
MMPVIVQQLARWFFSRRPMLGSFLCGLLVVSSLGVAYSSHETRNMYRDLQQLEKDHDDLEHEYEKLLLEQSAWAGYTRLNGLAQDKLQMTAPAISEMVVLR